MLEMSILIASYPSQEGAVAKNVELIVRFVAKPYPRRLLLSALIAVRAEGSER